MNNIKVLWAIIGVSLILHIIGWWLATSFYEDKFWVMETVHTAIEVAGSSLAIIVAYWIYTLSKAGIGPLYAARIAGALILMAMFDSFHALTEVGNLFVWFHSLATFLGGLLFLSIWLPLRIDQKLNYKFLIIVMLAACVIGGLSYYYVDAIPLMVEEGKFTITSILLNLLGGIFLLLSSVRFILTYSKTRNTDDLLFFLHCALFGMAALMFEQSEVWDFSWWTWHVLRFLAFVVAFWFVFLSQDKIFKSLKKSEQKLKTYNEDLQRGISSQTKSLKDKNDLLEQYTSLVSHDLKEPIRSVVSLTQIFEDKYSEGLDDRGKQIITYIKDSAKRMDELVNQLQIQGKIGYNSPPETVDVNELFRVIKRDLHQYIKDNKAKLNIGKMPVFTAYPLELRLLLQNMVSNAIKYSKENEHPVINVSCEDQGDYYLFKIADNGIGIEEKNQQKIFELFSRLHGRGRYEGLGIGLAQSKRVVELHAGEIWVESELGKGSTFSFTIAKDISSHL
ncbi:sensor histidine kinase [Lishizhenia sp.]|uniref:sensor histidine kinase n=1 Tax=Lishizhenia sp. TaxID=2497594 RepID=UPI00299EDCBC|nr:ATP-binding protein [Lishizhenia sp.]MDX1445399.1 ATP-binding protein [Lishizhenia sp.]